MIGKLRYLKRERKFLSFSQSFLSLLSLLLFFLHGVSILYKRGNNVREGRIELGKFENSEWNIEG